MLSKDRARQYAKSLVSAMVKKGPIPRYSKTADLEAEIAECFWHIAKEGAKEGGRLVADNILNSLRRWRCHDSEAEWLYCAGDYHPCLGCAEVKRQMIERVERAVGREEATR